MVPLIMRLIIPQTMLPGTPHGTPHTTLRNTPFHRQVVVTNISRVNRQLNVLVQVPSGSVPLQGDQMTKSHLVSLKSYATETIETSFYFPRRGQFELYPAQVAKGQTVIASATARDSMSAVAALPPPPKV